MDYQARNREEQRRWYYRHKNYFGRIYRIYNVVTGEDYVGCTTNTLKKRLQQAKAAAKNERRRDKLTENIRKWGPECFEIELLHEGTDREPAMPLETDFITERQPKLNKNLFQF